MLAHAHAETGNPTLKGKGKQSTSRTLLDALATAIDGTDAEETMRLAAEFNNSFGDLVRASVSPESEAGKDDLTLLGSFGPAALAGAAAKQSSTLKPKSKTGIVSKNKPVATKSQAEVIPVVQEDIGTFANPQIGNEALKRDHRESVTVSKSKKNKKGRDSSSEGSDESKPQKKKHKKKSLKKKKQPDFSSSSSSLSDTDSTSSDSDSSLDSDDTEKAELCYDITDFQSADLPDLPDNWDKGFKKL